MLRPVKTDLKKVQADLSKILTSKDILVGHSLENDLNVLKVIHDRVIDTSVLYPHPRGGRYKLALRSIAERYLNRRIQEGRDGKENSGHDSAEDAIASLELAQLKIEQGPQFGVSTGGTNLFDWYSKHRMYGAVMASGKTLQSIITGNTHAVPAPTDKQVLTKVAKQCSKGNLSLILGHISSLCDPPSTTKLKTLNEGIEEIYNSLKPNSLFILASGAGPSYDVQRLQREEMACIRQRKQWGLDKQTEKIKAEAERNSGVVFVGIKTKNYKD
uniref:Exonuclease domain-containing protein n=1 Tax=Amorphochlora amoebiformis TaxID=1561963 RepID=A0A7S0DNZ0_9EUKA|mmetsp:Transcript_4251/g.6457  ORF Transcript_4251/g.6457 Transcript_4251/m.6457 type:complete len:272 (+) Transcript_4251:1-816(+)